jgi:hypothetical protein
VIRTAAVAALTYHGVQTAGGERRELRKRATNVASRRRPGRDMLRSHSDVGGTTWRQMRSVPIHRGGHDGPRPSGFTLSSAARWPMRMLPTWRGGVGGRSRCRRGLMVGRPWSEGGGDNGQSATTRESTRASVGRLPGYGRSSDLGAWLMGQPRARPPQGNVGRGRQLSSAARPSGCHAGLAVTMIIRWASSSRARTLGCD